MDTVLRHTLGHVLDLMPRSQSAPSLKFQALNRPAFILEADIDQRLPPEKAARPERAIAAEKIIDEVEVAGVEFVDDPSLLVGDETIARDSSGLRRGPEMRDGTLNGIG